MMTILSNILENLKPPYIIETKNYGEFWSRKSFILHDRGDAIIPYWAIKGEENEGLHLKDSYIRNLIKSAKNHRDKYHHISLALLGAINTPIPEEYIEPNTGLP